MVRKNMKATTIYENLEEMEMHKYLRLKAAFYQKMHQQVLYKQEVRQWDIELPGSRP